MSLASAAVLGSVRPAFAEESVNGDEATTASAGARFVRWVITERKSDRANSIRVTDLVLTNGGVALADRGDDDSIVVTTPEDNNPENEGPNQGYDGDPETKWLDFAFAESEDPVSWTLEVSLDGGDWCTVDTRGSVEVTTDRYATVGPFGLGGSCCGDSGQDFGRGKGDLATSGATSVTNDCRATLSAASFVTDAASTSGRSGGSPDVGRGRTPNGRSVRSPRCSSSERDRLPVRLFDDVASGRDSALSSPGRIRSRCGSGRSGRLMSDVLMCLARVRARCCWSPTAPPRRGSCWRCTNRLAVWRERSRTVIGRGGRSVDRFSPGAGLVAR